MESRTMKYMDTSMASSRIERNSRLYKEVYDKYNEGDNLPLQDNSSLIDINKLREIVNGEEEKRCVPNKIDNIYDKKEKVNVVDQDVYDINKLLEKAKYENNKIKEPVKKSISNSRNILETLENKKISLEEVKKSIDYENNINNNKDNNLEMTRELKYHTKKISIDPLIEQIVVDDDNSPLDLLSDLKPSGNTIVTKPIKENDDNYIKLEDNFYSNDTSDIDIIKKNNNDIDDDFYTSSYKFSKKDFLDDDFSLENKSHNGVKIVLLIVLILILGYVIYFFIMNYGLK